MIFFLFFFILTHAKKNKIVHHTHPFLLIYSHNHFYNPSTMLIYTQLIYKKKSQILN
jgi:hypothetical protein